jgi:hypothetical protein
MQRRLGGSGRPASRAAAPKKINVACRLAGGDIDAVGKLEGDAHLATVDVAIGFAKLRGHNLTLDATARDA